MPSETFFRLPGEKRARIMAAAWEEFTSASLSQVSINRIVRGAGISRGSLYQYFADKDELFYYLIHTIQEEAADWFLNILRESGGDLFRAALEAYDQVSALRDHTMSRRCMEIAIRNPGLDFHSIASADSEALLERVWTELDISTLQRRDRESVFAVVRLCVLVLVHALVDALAQPQRFGENRLRLLEAYDIMQYGCVSALRAAAS